MKEHQIMWEEEEEFLLVTCGCGWEDTSPNTLKDFVSMEVAAQEHIRESAREEYAEAHRG